MIPSPLIKALPEPLRQRDQLGLIASIGFHGALFLGLAFLPATSPTVNTGRVVGLVDLSPAERNRLPNIAPTPAFPPTNPPPSVSTLPGLDLPPLSEIPDLSLLPPLPPLESFDLESLPPPVFIPRQSLPPTQPLDLPPPQIPAFPPRPLPPPAAPAAPPTPDFQLGTQLPQLKPEVFPPSNPVVPLNPPPPAPAPEPTNPAVVAAVNQLSTWINTARASYPNLELKRIVIPHPYPPQACPDQLQGFAQVGVIVDAKGQLVAAQPSLDLNLNPSPVKPSAQAELTNPQFLQSTGLPILDEAAIAAIKAQTFPASGNPQLLLIGFDFKYSEAVCSGTAPPAASPAPPTPDSPTPAASPPAPQPTAPLNLELSPPRPGAEETPAAPASPSPQPPEVSPPPVPEGSQNPQPSPGNEESNPQPQTTDFDLDLSPVPNAN